MKHRSPLWPVFVFGIIGIACLSGLTGRAALVTEPADSLPDALAKAHTYYRTTPKPTAHLGTPRVFRVPATGSMVPLIDSGHVAVIEFIRFEDVRPGDLVGFVLIQSPADMVRYGRGHISYFMHEVVRVTPKRIYTSGTYSMNNRQPRLESFGPNELIGIIRRSWQFR